MSADRVSQASQLLSQLLGRFNDASLREELSHRLTELPQVQHTDWADWCRALAKTIADRDSLSATDLAVLKTLTEALLVGPPEPNERRAPSESFAPDQLQSIAELYDATAHYSSLAGTVLAGLAVRPEPAAVELLAKKVSEKPPTDPQDVDRPLGLLLSAPPEAARHAFPLLLEALAHAHVAPAVLDVANHLSRKQVELPHPAAERATALAELLGQMVDGLERLEEAEQGASGIDPKELSEKVSQSVSLIVCLCHALGLIGDRSTLPKLHRAALLRHRRIHVEAAAALARFEEEDGIDSLVQLAADPVSRSRALAYLEELELLDRVEEKYRSPSARGAGDLVAFLSSAEAFGLPPSTMEVLDERTLSWPGYEQPVDCVLYSYEYQYGGFEFSGVGITGPVTYSFQVNLDDYPVDDIYCVFAGWHVDHEQIRLIPVADLDPGDREIIQNRLGELINHGFDKVELVFAGQFFDEAMPVATASRQATPGVIVVDGTRVRWFPRTASFPQPTPKEFFYMVLGRRLLTQFNEDWDPQ